MEKRLDRVLGELEQRYGMSEEFSAAVRPVAEKIFDPETPDARRPELLTLLAETYSRQAEISKNCATAIAGFEKLFKDLEELLHDAFGQPKPTPEEEED